MTFSVCRILLGLASAWVAVAADHQGLVRFGGQPLPGATVTAVGPRGARVSTLTGLDGNYSLQDLATGAWTIRVEMQCFEPAAREVAVGSDASSVEWDLKLLPLADITSRRVVDEPKPAASPEPQKPAQAQSPPKTNEDAAELNDRAADGFLINGSVNNGASTPFAIAPAFGNFRKGPGSLYNASIGFTAGNSAWDARSFSLTGQDTPKPGYNRLTGLLAFGGPIRIPHLMRNGPNLMLNYQLTRNRNATTQSGLMPTEAERSGTVPLSQMSPQARALLGLYPLPNFAGGSRYNYQAALTGATHQDSLQVRANKPVGRRDQLSGGFAFQSTRTDNTNLFGFLDTTGIKE